MVSSRTLAKVQGRIEDLAEEIEGFAEQEENPVAARRMLEVSQQLTSLAQDFEIIAEERE